MNVCVTLFTVNSSLQLSPANSRPAIRSHTSLMSSIEGLPCGDGGGSVGEMAQCLDLERRELILSRFEFFFGAVPHLLFQVRVL